MYENPSSGIDGWRFIQDFGSFAEGFYAALFAKRQLLCLALRGTDDGFDIIPDIQMFLGKLPDQVAQAGRAFRLAESRVTRGTKLAITGHSLGGGLATLLAVKTGRPAVTFNAPGVTRSLADSLPRDLITTSSAVPGELAQVRIVHIRARFDVVSIGTGPQIGDQTSIPVAGCAPVTSASRDSAFAAVAKLVGSLTPGQAIVNAPDVMILTKRFVLCQHGMALMEQQLRNMPEYRRDLGW